MNRNHNESNAIDCRERHTARRSAIPNTNGTGVP